MKKIKLPRKKLSQNRSSKEQLKSKIGQSPGTLVFSGKKKVENVTVQLYSFNQTAIDYAEGKNVKEILSHFNPERLNWINVIGLHDQNSIQEIGDFFELNSLLLEDVMNVNHRPKFDDYSDYIFFAIKMFKGVEHEELDYEQLSLVLGKNYVISFQEKEEDVFNAIRERMKAGTGRLRGKGADYLFYRLIDTVVDHYYLVIEHFAEILEDLEEEVFATADQSSLIKLQDIKKELIFLRRSSLPIRESLSAALKSENKLIQKETKPFLQDVYDHTIHIVESIETYRDLLGSIKDLYMNAVSMKMNEVMKVLTIISTIFIPITFIAGVYGMNFNFMPELQYKYSYPIAWAIMIIMAIIMIIFFKRKKWL